MAFGKSSSLGKGETYKVKIEDKGKEGDGITKIKDVVVFVPETEIGDEVRIKITKVLRTMAFGKVIEELDEKNDLKSKSEDLFYKAKEKAVKAKKAGFEINKIMDDLIESKKNHKKGDYKKSISNSKKVIKFAKKDSDDIKLADIKLAIANLKKEEEMIDTRDIEKALEKDDIEKAMGLVNELKQDYERYIETIEKLEKLDEKQSSLAEQLADKEINRDVYEDAVEKIEHKKTSVEDKLEKLREKVIHEDYQKPF